MAGDLMNFIFETWEGADNKQTHKITVYSKCYEGN